MDVRIEDSWKARLQDEFDKPYFAALTQFVRNEYAAGTVYPPGREMFAAFDACPFDDVRVVILGQDPYHEPGQAHGLCFSVNDGVQFPPSLVNIFKEIESDLGRPMPSSGNLMRWAKQGVLLLNATLTVRAHQAGSHQNKGWEEFTDIVIKRLSEREKPVIFILWGNNAKKKLSLIDRRRHYALMSAHPSPLSASRGFFGCNHFAEANRILKENGEEPIDWQIENI